MTILTALKSHDDVADEVDSLGGGNGFLVESGIHDCTVEYAYLTTAKSGALFLSLRLQTADGISVKLEGSRNGFCMTSGTAKGCLNYYIDQKTQKKKNLPGFEMANALALLSVGKEIGDIPTEEKVINLYDYDAGKEIPTKVTMFTELVGKPITAGIWKCVEDKTALNAQTGNYDPTGETYEKNDVDKFFRTRDGLTVSEIKAGITEAVFKDQWAEKWTGQVKNNAKGMTGAQAGVTTAPMTPAANQPNAAGAPASLFG